MTNKKPYNAADEEMVNKRKEKASLKIEMIDSAFKSIVSTKEGRAFIWWLLSICGVFRVSFTSSTKDSETFFREGERNIGLRIMDKLNRVCPEAYLQMIHEKNEENNV